MKYKPFYVVYSLLVLYGLLYGEPDFVSAFLISAISCIFGMSLVINENKEQKP